MKIYWRWSKIPELDGLSRPEQRRLLRTYLHKNLLSAEFWVTLSFVALVIGIASACLQLLIKSHILRTICSGIGVGLIVFIMGQVQTSRAISAIRKDQQGQSKSKTE